MDNQHTSRCLNLQRAFHDPACAPVHLGDQDGGLAAALLVEVEHVLEGVLAHNVAANQAGGETSVRGQLFDEGGGGARKGRRATGSCNP